MPLKIQSTPKTEGKTKKQSDKNHLLSGIAYIKSASCGKYSPTGI